MVITMTQKTKFALLDSGATENFLDPRTVESVEAQRGKRWSVAEYRPVSKNWSAQAYKIHYLYI